MDISRFFYGRQMASGVLCAIFATLTLCTDLHAQCPDAYSVEVIFGLPKPPQFGGGYWPLIPQAINNNTEVVGYHSTLGGNIAFKWSPDDGLEILEMPPGTIKSIAYDISDNGVIVGEYDVTNDGLDVHGFAINGEKFITIQPLNGGIKSIASAANLQSQVVGEFGNAKFEFPFAFLWEGRIPTDLNPILGTENSEANDITDASAIVGWMGTGSVIDAHAFIYQDGKITDLGTIPNGFTGRASAISQNGFVVGSGQLFDSEKGDTVIHAFFWNGSEILDLGTLPGFFDSNAFDVNEAGTTVGRLKDGSPGKGFVWSNDVMTKLEDLIVHDPDLQISISSAIGINSAGQIAAGGSVEVEPGEYEPAMLICTPIPTFGDLNGDCTVDNVDLGYLLGEWQKNSSSADLNDDGIVDGLDLGLLLGSWG